MSPLMPSWEELKRRKLVQWALAYLAGAWVALQLLDVVAEPWGIGTGLLLAAQIILAFGFFATLVLAWYHGEQGRQRMSGPELLMLAALLVVAGSAVAFVRDGGEARSPDADQDAAALVSSSIPQRSIAVLPLENQSPAEEHAYLAPALTDEITDALTRVPELRVTSYNSASQYPGSGKTVPEFALEELGVAHVIEGSVQRLDDEVRIRVQLIDARSDEHIWSETYQQELTDVFDAQVDIARQVADRLAASFTDREIERFEAGSTDDPAAYELYLRAKELRNSQGAVRTEKITLLRRALDRDPEFGLAWLLLGGTYLSRVADEGSEWADSARIAWERALESAEKPAARLWLQSTLAFQAGDVEQAGTLIEEALAADSTFYPAVADGRLTYEGAGDLSEAARLARRAAAFDPLNGFNWRYLGSLYRTVGLDSLAERTFRRAIDVEAASIESWEELLELRLYQGRYERASVAADSLETRDPREAIVWRAIIDAWSGEENRARPTLEEVYESRESGAFWGLADLLAHLRLLEGDTTSAHALLDEAEEAIGQRQMPFRFVTRILHWNAMQIAAVREDVDEAVSSFREYVDLGGRNVRDIAPNPVFARVLDDPAFQAELEKLERLVERQRRQIERDLADERR